MGVKHIQGLDALAGILVHEESTCRPPREWEWMFTFNPFSSAYFSILRNPRSFSLKNAVSLNLSYRPKGISLRAIELDTFSPSHPWKKASISPFSFTLKWNGSSLIVELSHQVTQFPGHIFHKLGRRRAVGTTETVEEQLG